MNTCQGGPVSARSHSLTYGDEQRVLSTKATTKAQTQEEADIDSRKSKNIAQLIALFNLPPVNNQNVPLTSKKQLSESSDSSHEKIATNCTSKKKAKGIAKQILCEFNPNDQIRSDLITLPPTFTKIQPKSNHPLTLLKQNINYFFTSNLLKNEIKNFSRSYPSPFPEINIQEENDEPESFVTLSIFERILNRLTSLESVVQNIKSDSQQKNLLLYALKSLKTDINFNSVESNSFAFNIYAFLVNLEKFEDNCGKGKFGEDIRRYVYNGIHGKNHNPKEVKNFLMKIADFFKNGFEVLKSSEGSAVINNYYKESIRTDIFRSLFGTESIADHRDTDLKVLMGDIYVNDELMRLENSEVNRKELQKQFFSTFIVTVQSVKKRF